VRLSVAVVVVVVVPPSMREGLPHESTGGPSQSESGDIGDIVG